MISSLCFCRKLSFKPIGKWRFYELSKVIAQIISIQLISYTNSVSSEWLEEIINYKYDTTLITTPKPSKNQQIDH